VNVKILGNTPIGVHSYRYSRRIAQDTGAFGGKIFFFKAFYVNGEIGSDDLNTLIANDFLWLTREEAKQRLKSKYWKSLNSCLFLEGMPFYLVSKTIETVKGLREKHIVNKKSLQQ
jgi:39S ribosomal protein L46, putative (fragment)